MKEYSIIGNEITFEEHFRTKRELIAYLKNNNVKAKEVSQIFYKTYTKELVEKDCVLLFCKFQKINLLNLD